MADPRVVPRAEHSLSRRDIDPDALKVLYRLREHDHIAYLVGGSVRDLLLGRRPKDFDVGTSAHPHQIKKIFRNCWIIGRRFRLAHVRFGTKVIEVATFRRQVQPGEEVAEERIPARPSDGEPVANHHLIHRDNTFGTPEQDAFRRDFTVNALFYDIATFAIIDYVGGLEDLGHGLVRSIGDPEVRFREDPVRMLRAVALAERLDFAVDELVLAAVRLHRHEITRSAPPRLLEECYKILRAGSAEKTFRRLADVGLMEAISPELHRGAEQPLWKSLAAVDAYRRNFSSNPETLTNAVLLGSLLVPLGLAAAGRHSAAGAERAEFPAEAVPRLGTLPLARRDVEHLRQILGLQRRLCDLGASVRAQRALTHRAIFRDALTWMEIHGGAPEIVEHWITVLAERGADEPPGLPTDAQPVPFRRRRRNRRRRFHPSANRIKN